MGKKRIAKKISFPVLLEHDKNKSAGQKEYLQDKELMLREKNRKQKEEAELLKKAKFKPGDHVRISQNPVLPDEFPGFFKEMEPFKGKVVTIQSYYGPKYGGVIYHLYRIIKCNKHWAERWLEPVEEKEKQGF